MVGVSVTDFPVPQIKIPPGLLPADGRFGSGPAKVRPEALAALAATGRDFLGTSHRRPPVKGLVAGLRQGLGELFGLPDGYEIALGNGGTNMFWDAAIFGLIAERSQHLSFGEFSAKFAEAVRGAPHLQEPSVVVAEAGSRPTSYPQAGIDLYALTQNETSTGVMAPVLRPPGADAGSLVAVDATSAAGGLEVAPDQFDVYYFSPQKCFSSDGGLWVAALSPAAVDRIRAIKASGRWTPPSLDLGIALDNSRQEQTYNTPALATLFLFYEQLAWILENGGLPWAAARSARSAGALYDWAESRDFAEPFVAVPEQRSTVVGTIDLVPPLSADLIATLLRQNGIVDTEGYRSLKRNQLRVGMFPSVDPADIEALTACIDYLVGAVG